MRRANALPTIGTASRKTAVEFLSREWRFEALRQALRREIRTHSGQRVLAATLGVGRSVIRKFLELRSTPSPHNLEVLEAWAEDRPAVSVPTGAVCLALLAGDLEPGLRYNARLRLAKGLAELYADSACPVPTWLRDEISDRTGA
jgi:hypothetical protein